MDYRIRLTDNDFLKRMEMQGDNRPAVNIGPSAGDDDTARASNYTKHSNIINYIK